MSFVHSHKPLLLGVLVAAFAASLLLPVDGRAVVATTLLVAIYFAVTARIPVPFASLKDQHPHFLMWLIFYLAVPVAAISWFAAQWMDDPMQSLDVKERAERLIENDLPERAENLLEEAIKRSPDDPVLHRLRVWAHFEQPARRGKHDARDDKAILVIYRSWPQAHPASADIGPMALAACYRRMKNYAEALAAADRAQDPDFQRIQLERGWALMKLERYADAAAAFERAMKLPSDRAWAVRGVAESRIALQQWEAVRQLLASEAGNPDLRFALRKLQLHHGDWAGYLRTWMHLPDSPPMALLLAALTGILWLLAIRWWDCFEDEPLGLALITVLLGAIASNLVFVVHDVLDQFVALELRASGWNDLGYAVVVIGVVEESVKFLPVLFVRRFTRHMNEPVDWAIYGAYSALGFAIWENVSYHAAYGLQTVVPRALSSVPFHICMSALVGFFIWEGHRLGWRKGTGFLLGIACAALIHGLYDFFLVGPLDVLRILAMACLLYAVTRMTKGLQRSLADSPFRPGDGVHARLAGGWFIKGYILLLCACYVAQIHEIGVGLAWINATFSILVNGLSIFLLFMLAFVNIPAGSTKPGFDWLWQFDSARTKSD